MRWLLAGILFALVIGLTVATAAVKADNVRHRYRLQEIADHREAWLAAYRAELIRRQEFATVEQLDEMWRAYVERSLR